MIKKSAVIMVSVLMLMLVPISKATSDGSSEVVLAKEILDKIKMGLPVEYKHVIIKGDLNLSKIDLPTISTDRTDSSVSFLGNSKTEKLVSSPIIISDSNIEGPINFANVFFGGQINFADTFFRNHSDFSESQFNICANFRGSNFSSDAFFNGSQINGYADFSGSRFSKYATFKSSNFNNIASFKFSRFDNYAGFLDSKFNSYIDFSMSQFDRYADFSGTQFDGYANFRGPNFRGYADFSSSNFNGIADFKLSKFNGYADFSSSNFNGIADFTRSEFNNSAYFAGSCFNDTFFKEVYFNEETSFNDCRFNGITSFNSSQFKGDALFDKANFLGKLSLTRTRYNKLFIRWISIKSLTYDDSAYLSLLRNFKALGYLEDYDYCYFEYRKAYRNQPWPLVDDKEAIIRKGIDFLLEWFYGYGTKPLNVLYFSLGIIGFFGLFWKGLGLGGPKDVTLLRPGQEKTSDGVLSILGYSATVFLSGTKLFIDPPATPKIKGRSQSMTRRAFILERLLGALFSILFFLAVSGTIVRQIL